MEEATIKLSCRGLEHLETIKEILNNLKDITVYASSGLNIKQIDEQKVKDVLKEKSQQFVNEKERGVERDIFQMFELVLEELGLQEEEVE